MIFVSNNVEVSAYIYTTISEYTITSAGQYYLRGWAGYIQLDSYPTSLMITLVVDSEYRDSIILEYNRNPYGSPGGSVSTIAYMSPLGFHTVQLKIQSSVHAANVNGSLGILKLI